MQGIESDNIFRRVHLSLGSTFTKTLLLEAEELYENFIKKVQQLFNLPDNIEFQIQDLNGNRIDYDSLKNNSHIKLCIMRGKKPVLLPNKEVLNDEQLKAVIDLITSGSLDVITDEVSKKKYKCSFKGCRKSFDDIYKLKHHFKIHSFDRQHKCIICKKGFTTRGHLKSHENTHIKEKPYLCSYYGCNKSYAREQRLNIHLRTHTGDKPYICKVKNCGKAFAEKGNLKTHIRTHTGEKPYICNFPGCNRNFTTQGHLTDHKRRHTGDRPFNCKICNKAFMRSSTMKTHLKKHKLNILDDKKILESDEENGEETLNNHYENKISFQNNSNAELKNDIHSNDSLKMNLLEGYTTTQTHQTPETNSPDLTSNINIKPCYEKEQNNTGFSLRYNPCIQQQPNIAAPPFYGVYNVNNENLYPQQQNYGQYQQPQYVNHDINGERYNIQEYYNQIQNAANQMHDLPATLPFFDQQNIMRSHEKLGNELSFVNIQNLNLFPLNNAPQQLDLQKLNNGLHAIPDMYLNSEKQHTKIEPNIHFLNVLWNEIQRQQNGKYSNNNFQNGIYPPSQYPYHRYPQQQQLQQAYNYNTVPTFVKSNPLNYQQQKNCFMENHDNYYGKETALIKHQRTQRELLNNYENF